MMKKNYTNYSVDDLLEDHEFVSFVIRSEGKVEWDEFLQANCNTEKTILRAQKIILSFRVNEPVLQDVKKQELWTNITSFKRQQEVSKPRVIRLTYIRKIAATFILAISIGGLLYYLHTKTGEQYTFSDVAQSIESSNPVLVLSNGKKIDLQDEKARVVVLKGQDSLKINKETIIGNTVSVKEKSGKVKLNEVVTPFGKKSTILLEDQTIVYLNAGSRFAFPQKFTGNKREVYIEGEGLFVVHKDSLHPFIVHSTNLNVEVYGTRFNMSAYSSDDFARVVLIQGSVAVWKNEGLFNSKKMMVPNQKATLSLNDHNLTVESDHNPKASYAWIDGYYPFANENIAQVLKKVERYYNVRFKYNEDLMRKTLPVSGKLDMKESLPKVLDVISQVAKFDYKIDGNEVFLVKREK